MAGGGIVDGPLAALPKRSDAGSSLHIAWVDGWQSAHSHVSWHRPFFRTLRIGACEGLTDARASCCAANGGVRLFAELNSEILNANADAIAN